MFCRKCGTKLLEGSAYCTACGTPVILPPPTPKESDEPLPEQPAVQPAEPPVQDAAEVLTASAAEEAAANDTQKKADTGGEEKKAAEPKETAHSGQAEQGAAEVTVNNPDLSAIIVDVPVFVVTDPVKPTNEKPNSAEHFFEAAGSLSGRVPVGARAEAAGVPKPPPVVTHHAPKVSAPPETGGYVDKVADRPTPAAAYPPAGMHADPPYAFETPMYPEPAADNESKHNILLWIIIGILAIGIIGAGCVLLFVPQVHNAVFGEPEISISYETQQLSVGDKTDLNDILSLDHVDANKIGWKSSDPAVATVRDGKVEAVGIGACTITVYAKQDEGISDSIEITVVDASGT